MPKELLLTGVPAFVGQVLAAKSLKFFAADNIFDPTKMIDVDLAKNPKLIAPANWGTDVVIDQHESEGGFTTIGPFFNGGRHIGGAYLSQSVYAANSSKLAGWPETYDALYQFQAVLRENNGVITRYHGFKVRVIGAGVQTLAHLAFIPSGSVDPVPGSPVHWVDLADATICDPRANGYTTIDASSPVGTEGALFLTTKGMTTYLVGAPKVPPGYGW